VLYITPKPHPQYALHYGGSAKTLALVIPDDIWPGMWRIAWPDGRLSDMVNLTRAKDAAEVLAERGPPHRNPRLFHWESHAHDSPAEGGYSAQTGLGGQVPRRRRTVGVRP